MKRKIVVFIIAFALIFSTAFAVSQVDSNAAVTKPTEIVSLEATSTTVDVKGKVYVKVTEVLPEDASKSVKWKSSNKKVATVSSSGTVYGKKKGYVYITATSKYSSKVKKSIKIYVKDFKASTVTFDKTKMELYAGKTSGTIKATLGPVGVYNKGLTWYRCDGPSGVIKWSGKSTGATVTPTAEGEVTLRAKSKEASSVYADCNVIVKKIAFKNTKDKVLRLGTGSYTNPATITPANAEFTTVNYTSSNDKVATVNSAGTVTPKGVGTAKIIATADDNDKVSVSYNVTVKRTEILYDTDSNGNCVYELNSSICSKYQVAGNREATNEDIEYIIDEDAVINAFGDEGVDVWSRSSVESDFLGSSFSFITGDYEVSKAAGDGVRLKYKLDDGTPVSSHWYYRTGEDETEGSMNVVSEPNDGAYILTLFSTPSGPVEDRFVVELKDDVISFQISGTDKKVRITNTGDNSLNLHVTDSEDPTVDFTFQKNGSGDGYKLIVPKEYVQKYEVHIFLWEKK